MILRPIINDNKGSYVGIFIFIIFAFVLIMLSGIWFYIGGQTEDLLHSTLDNITILNQNGNNASQVIDETFGDFPVSLNALKWTTVMIFVGMGLSIWFGSYLVQSKPIFFVPYIFLVIIAVVVSVPISNAYESLLADATIGSSFQEFTMANFVILLLPIWVSVIGIFGGVIMFSQMGRKQESFAFFG